MARDIKSGASLLLALPLVVSIAFLLIVDIDSPRSGIVRVIPQTLTSLAGLLRARGSAVLLELLTDDPAPSSRLRTRPTSTARGEPPLNLTR